MKPTHEQRVWSRKNWGPRRESDESEVHLKASKAAKFGPIIHTQRTPAAAAPGGGGGGASSFCYVFLHTNLSFIDY